MSGAYWTTTWNPVEGCTPISEGCDRCWAAVVASRFKGAYPDLACDGHWTGGPRCRPDRLEEPLHWRKPRAVFVANMGDLFHIAVPTAFVRSVFEVMYAAPQHTYLLLTKRAKRMRGAVTTILAGGSPLPNVWLGVTAENQARADERIPHLLATPAAHRWVSVEPMLGPINLHPWLCRYGDAAKPEQRYANICEPSGALSWIACGCESGPGARDMAPNWARSIRDQCAAAGVHWMLKQACLPVGSRIQHLPELDGVRYDARPGHEDTRNTPGPEGLEREE